MARRYTLWKGVTNAMNLVVFQPNSANSEQSLKLPQDMKTKKLMPNRFNELLLCTTPKKKDFRRNDACKSFSRDIVPTYNNIITSNWLIAKSLEFVVSEGYNKLAENQTIFVKELLIPTWSGSNSLLGKSINKEELTNIFNNPLINGSAHGYSAILTGITMANDITSYLRGHGSKSNISLDLDLYETVYLLVNTREDLRNKYVICLGELHIVFADLRAIGTFIECSGVDDAWVRADLFGENTCKQVMNCSRMNRAVQCHESTWIAISISILQTIVNNSSGNNLTPPLLINILGELQIASQGKNEAEFKKLFSKFVDCIKDIKIDFCLENFKSLREGKSMFQFICCYLEILSSLFYFIYASRARNWDLHLSSLQNIMPAIIMMGRIKYRRWGPVYLADMIGLKTAT